MASCGWCARVGPVRIADPPRDETAPHVGTIFHERLADGSMLKRKQMRFVPNTGYASAVGDDTWHSVDPVGPEVTTRDSILLTCFVDTGLLKYLRNRGKRAGNFLLNELRQGAKLRRGRPDAIGGHADIPLAHSNRRC
jgi:hypothetical protein